MTGSREAVTAEATTPGEPPRRRPHRPRAATVGMGLTFLLGTALLLWGADLLARWGAENLLARNIEEATGVPTRPEVDVHGTFFLPQVVQGRYDDVEITVRDLTSGPLRIAEVRARLSGVHVSFHDVLLQEPDPVWIEESVEEAFLGYEDLNRYLDATGRPVTVAGAGDEVQLTGTAEVLGESVSASTRAALSFDDDGALVVRPTEVDTDTALDPASSLLLGQRFSFLVPLDPLPFGQQLTGVQATGSGLVVRARGADVVLRS